MLIRRFSLATLVVSVLVGCGTDEPPAAGAPAGAPPATERVLPAAPEADEASVRIVFLGDSLTAGFGLPEEAAFPALIEQRLAEEGRPVRVVNAGVSGDTSAAGLSRLDWVLRQEPDILFVSLGANDGLRGLSPEMTEANLRRIVEKGRAVGAEVVLAGMRLPPNYGPQYVEAFEAVFPRLARELDLRWIPFLLEGVAGRRSLNLADGIHPNAAGHVKIATLVLPAVRDAVEAVEAERG